VIFTINTASFGSHVPSARMIQCLLIQWLKIYNTSRTSSAKRVRERFVVGVGEWGLCTEIRVKNVFGDYPFVHALKEVLSSLEMKGVCMRVCVHKCALVQMYCIVFACAVRD